MTAAQLWLACPGLPDSSSSVPALLPDTLLQAEELGAHNNMSILLVCVPQRMGCQRSKWEQERPLHLAV